MFGRRVARPRRRAAPRRKVGGRRMRGFRRAFRKVANPMPVFTEMLQTDGLTATAGGCFQYSINQVPQYASYKALYRQYRIVAATVILLPRQVTNTTGGATITDYGQPPQIVYALNESSDAVVPTTKLEVLESNGAKVRLLTQPLKIKFRPVADLNVNINGAMGGIVPINLGRDKFIGFDNDGSDVIHRGVDFWYENWSSAPLATDVYVKITFQLRDPR